VGVPCWAALVGRGGHRGVGRAVCACFVLCLSCVLRFLQVLSRIPPSFLGDPLGYPRQPYDVKLRVFELKKKKV
jgi:hypothetical protein